MKAIAGLAYSLFMIIYLVLPAVFSGYSPIWMSILCGILSTAVTLLLLNGQSEKTWAAILSTTVGVICSLLLFLIMSHLVHIDGFSSSEAEGLVPVSYTHLIMGWADKYRTMKVRTNADTPADAKKARELGAEGIGLCRTEHMFFEGNRIDAFREMICSETEEEREAALEKILPEQQGDFEKLYEALEGLSLIHISFFSIM